MPIAAQLVIRKCVETLQDADSTRWPVGELVRYLNDGQREIIVPRPDATSTRATLDLVAGSRQSLPGNGAKLIDVIRNTAATRRTVRKVNVELLDAQLPGWHHLVGVTEIIHFMYDPREPRTFYVYPPAAVPASLEIVYSALPTDVAVPPDGSLFTDVVGDIGVADIYANALQDYILYRAWTKDSDFAANGHRAMAHLGAFAQSIGIEIGATITAGPQTSGT